MQPFGTYHLPRWLDRIRRLGDHTPSGWLGLKLTSGIRRACLTFAQDPIDLVVADGVNLRLYPRSNRCEKRVFAGQHLWDADERAVLVEALEQHASNRPFVFLDVGANVGLYSLFLEARARELETDLKIVAVEPDPENRSRLEANASFSRVRDVTIEAVGISGAAGRGTLVQSKHNRGEVKLSHELGHDLGADSSVQVDIVTLPELIARNDLTHIDAMKIDIEGEDKAALATLLADVPQHLWPSLIIAETGRHTTTDPISDLCIQHGYKLKHRFRLNVVLTYSPTTQTNPKS